MKSYDEILKFAETHTFQEVFDEIFDEILFYYLEEYDDHEEKYFNDPDGYQKTQYMTLVSTSLPIGESILADDFFKLVNEKIERIKEKYKHVQYIHLSSSESGMRLCFYYVKIEDKEAAVANAKRAVSDITWKLKKGMYSLELCEEYNKYL